MELLTLVKQESPGSYGESTGGQLRLNRRGELVSNDFIRQAALDGRMFSINCGTISTALTWTATASLDRTKPMLSISVPSGTTIIPVSIELYMQAYGTNAAFEVMAEVGTGGTAQGTAVVPICLRTDAPNTTTITAYELGTAATAPTASINEFWRDGQQFAITKTTAKADSSIYDPNRFTWSLLTSASMPVCVGASQLFISQGSNAGTGFLTVCYIEYPSTSII